MPEADLWPPHKPVHMRTHTDDALCLPQHTHNSRERIPEKEEQKAKLKKAGKKPWEKLSTL